MKRYLLLLPGVLFPYASIALIWALMATAWGEAFLQRNFEGNPSVVCILIGALWVAAVLFTVIGCVVAGVSKRPAEELARLALLWKLVQIPSYVIVFIYCLILMIMPVWGWILLAVAFCFDLATVLLSGIFGCVAARRAVKNGKVGVGLGVLLALGQFFFVIDLVCAGLLWGVCRLKK